MSNEPIVRVAYSHTDGQTTYARDFRGVDTITIPTARLRELYAELDRLRALVAEKEQLQKIVAAVSYMLRNPMGQKYYHGHTCFEYREEDVRTVANMINEYVKGDQ